MEKENFTRNCPKCNKLLSYSSKKNRNQANRKRTFCGSCSSTIFQNEPIHKAKLAKITSLRMKGSGNSFYGKTHTEETKRKIALADKSYAKTKQFRNRMSEVTKGGKNPMYGKTYYDKWVEKYGKEEADKRHVLKVEKNRIASTGSRNPMYGKPSPHGSGNGWSGWYKGWYFRSIKELSYMINVIEVNNFKWRTGESKDLQIRYIDYKGDARTYRADFFINDKILLEIKPLKLMNTPNNILKKEAAIIFCKHNNYEYRMVDIKLIDIDVMISMYKNKIVKFVKKYQERMEQLICKLERQKK
jgi:hypothetical protein